MQPSHTPPRPRAAVAAPLGRHAGRLTASGFVASAIEDLRGVVPRLWWTEVERRRLFLWLPVFFGLGILLYFAADREPQLWAPVSATLAAGLAALRLRARWPAYVAFTALAFLFAGFSAAALRTRAVAAPILPRVMVGSLTGFVESVEERRQGARIVVALVGFADLAVGDRPSRVRVTLRPGTAVKPGDFIEATARLLPPPEPARPGGYDFAREAFFRSTGAVGSISGAVRVRAPPVEPPGTLALATRIDQARNALTRRIADAAGGQAGAVAAALVTGKRGLISEETNAALRAAGIYHIVSISGLHMVLAASTIFGAARALLALFPGAALLWPTKKIAAVIAMFGATAYCIFSGSEVATERSLVMTLVMLAAILVDRPALAMRNLAVAALIVLAREPETLLGPSFQMSFAAVAGLVAFCEGARPASAEASATGGGWPSRVGRMAARAIIALFVTTLVASIMTAPFGAYHFQTLNPFGLIGNALAVPFVSLLVMPAAVLGTLAYPFGLDAPVWWAMGLATRPVLAVGAWVSGFERATTVIPAFDTAVLLLFTLALLLATLWSTALRWLALPPALLGIALAANPVVPDIVVERSGAAAAVRQEDGRLAVVGRASRFTLEHWLRADGDARTIDDATLKTAAGCDPWGCVAPLPGGRYLAVIRDKRAFAEDCRRAAIVISSLKAPETCKAELVLDRSRLAATGAVHLVSEDGRFRLVRARQENGERPWLRRLATPPARAQRAQGSPSQLSIPDPEAHDDEVDAAQ
ncbi:ComEC/Rec2 family competence protein [Chelatococcus sp. SYSU_G07232]|uniref:ComEC/Rec2 family competence protein n=1 Tax=Chelatococcus albus TaxID=3047466 RepID=A0ABT7ABP7_9HYPH|nr:ComEC/Rec2 family competence protein [Chelatococcus sp. SYSU_G07232]MDJ1156784.1 ComEC/Rec2 family competence protein [Chelatococcus sp. SYSU_G07232]